MAVLLELQGVVKHFRRGAEDVVALDGVDLAVGAGEAVALVGPSGSGKSTLLHLAGGLDVPDAGAVRVDGRDLAGLGVAARARLRRREIGFVFQFFHLLPSLTVAENVELPLLLDGRRGRAASTVVAGALDRVGVGHRADHLPGELSGGELQRAAIARALVGDPRLLLADEPTGNLDSTTGRAVLDLLSSLVRESGTSLVMVTHDEAAAARTGRVVRLLDGHLVDGGVGPATEAESRADTLGRADTEGRAEAGAVSDTEEAGAASDVEGRAEAGDTGSDTAPDIEPPATRSAGTRSV